MPSDRQIQANRENARRSTGPRTPLGKARASLNAVRHGLSARNAVLPGEDQQAYLELHASIEAHFQPQGPIETFLVGQMASAQWRLQRLARIEFGFFIAGTEEIKEKERNPSGSLWAGRNRTAAPTLSEEDEVTRLLGVLFKNHCGCDSFALLSRYENMLNAEYFRAFRNLTSLRNARSATDLPPVAGPSARTKTNPIPPAPLSPPPRTEPRPSGSGLPSNATQTPPAACPAPFPSPGTDHPRPKIVVRPGPTTCTLQSP